jgi:hypothetical protein
MVAPTVDHAIGTHDSSDYYFEASCTLPGSLLPATSLLLMARLPGSAYSGERRQDYVRNMLRGMQREQRPTIHASDRSPALSRAPDIRVCPIGFGLRQCVTDFLPNQLEAVAPCHLSQ